MPEPQFLSSAAGPLFVLYHPPHPAARRRGGILYVPPFAEELNKARRMAALQAQRFAAAGFGVLLPDLYGCGDSAGDFREARWPAWRRQLGECADWLQARTGPPLYLWGLRLGAVLASEAAQELAPTGLILWQPVLRGDVHLTQFLRLRLAAGLAAGQRETGADLRARLAAGASLEIGGYELHPELAAALDRARLQPPPPGTRVAWFELTTAPEPRPAPAGQEWVNARRAAGIEVMVRMVAGEPFWATSEIVCVPALIEATLQNLWPDA